MDGENSTTSRRRMPVGRPFQKGRSGNPRGRPKESAEFKEWLQRKFASSENREKLWGRAQESDYLMKSLLEYAFGKAPQPVEASGEVSHRHYVAQFERPDGDTLSPTAEQPGPEIRH